MASSFAKWEADPFFPAAEEVQNSADRMESALRTWKRVRGLGKLSGGISINAYRRELITALETVKWQLQEFERAVEAGVCRERQHRDKDTPSRHALFVGAIKSQVYFAEKVLEDAAEQNDLAPTSIHGKLEDGSSLIKFLSGCSSDFDDGPQDVVMSFPENSPAAWGLEVSVESCHDRDVDSSFGHWQEYSNAGTKFVNERHECILDQSLIPQENLPRADYRHEASSPSCTPAMCMSAGVSLQIGSYASESGEVSSSTTLCGDSDGLDRDWKDREIRSMEGSKGMLLFSLVRMLKSAFMSNLEQDSRTKSGNCHKVPSGHLTSDFLNQQKKRPATLKKAVQLRSWMQHRIPHGRILQILSALLILISFVGISIM